MRIFHHFRPSPWPRKLLNFLNHASIIRFYSGFLETWLYWNNGISIDDFFIDVIIWANSTFLNKKFNSLIEIYFLKIVNFSLFFYRTRKENKLTLNDQASTRQCTSQCIHPALNGPPLVRWHRTRWACVEKGCLCLKCLFMVGIWGLMVIKALLKELAALMTVWCITNFFLSIYTN